MQRQTSTNQRDAPEQDTARSEGQKKGIVWCALGPARGHERDVIFSEVRREVIA
jgi:hypothetical protein